VCVASRVKRALQTSCTAKPVPYGSTTFAWTFHSKNQSYPSTIYVSSVSLTTTKISLPPLPEARSHGRKDCVVGETPRREARTGGRLATARAQRTSSSRIWPVALRLLVQHQLPKRRPAPSASSSKSRHRYVLDNPRLRLLSCAY
jgi:hypothetical protein